MLTTNVMFKLRAADATFNRVYAPEEVKAKLHDIGPRLHLHFVSIFTLYAASSTLTWSLARRRAHRRQRVDTGGLHCVV